MSEPGEFGAENGRSYGRLVPVIDYRVPIIAQMAATIFCEKLVYHDNKDARRMAVDQAFMLYGEIVIRLAENDK